MKNILKYLTKTAITIVASLAVILIPSVTVFADEKPAIWLQVSPVANRITLVPGQVSTHTMQVDNVGSKKFKFRVYAAPYSVANEAYEIDFNKETKRTQLSRWISFNSNKDAKNDAEKKWSNEVSYDLEPGQHQSIEYKVDVPSDIPAGGQYAAVFAESVPSDDAGSTGVRTISRVGSIVYGSTAGKTNEKVVFSNFSTKTFMTKGKISSEIDIKNEGNTDFTANVTLKVSKLIGGSIAEVSRPYPVIPDSPTRHAVIEWGDTPIFGIFQTKTTVTAINQKFEETRIIVVMPIFMIIIMLILLTMVIVWLIILIRKRRAQKSRLII